MGKANDKEEGVRKSMRGLVDGTYKGGESYALTAYMHIAKQRLANWGAEVDRFKEWASQSMLALL